MMNGFRMSALASQLEQRIRANRLLSLPLAWDSEMIYPYYDGLSIFNVAQTVMHLLGAPVERPLDSAVWGDESPLGQVERVVLFLTDGLGYLWLNEIIQDDPSLPEVVSELTDGRGFIPLTSTAPSTTVVALPTLWTAAQPIAHGMLGTYMYLPRFATLGNMLSYAPVIGDHKAGVLGTWGLLPDQFVPVPSLPQRLAECGVPTHLLLDKNLINTGLSHILHRGVQVQHRHAGTLDVWLRLEDVLTETTGQKCYVHAYLPTVDTLSHLYGARSRYVRNEVRYQLNALRTLLASPQVQDGKTLVMILADHGHFDTPNLIDFSTGVTENPIRRAMRTTFAGDTRFSQLFLRDGQRQRVIEHIVRDYAELIAWFEPEAAIHAGLFGTMPMHPELQDRLGDLILTTRLGSRLKDELRPGKEFSVHGGLSDREMLVPFIWKRI